ncbi:ABC transporter permease [Acidisphaera rubrifaciens]|uniref:ABC transporter monosaccharide permease n=1 Tax=Acidisphaera rubrifaciens HS-AP3 TaxID=1231350 RepID=A0A0D6P6Y3_9PROT|nr:ABC transporter permease [Acidisphaera rubrifaciens]GAN77432.1 ABC transporter monosaccharide permease [Acidisphaera rubrifaciens HS-AP3]
MKIALTQERIVFALAVLLFAGFAIVLPNFLTAGNVLTLIRGVSVLGILGLGMAVVVIGRGIDLSIVANMAISVAWTLDMADRGVPLGVALSLGFGFVVLMGLITGFLVAYVEIPPLFATLAMGAFIYGFGRAALLSQDVIQMPAHAGILNLAGTGHVLGVPMPIILLAVASLLAFLFLRYTRPGRTIYGFGDNLQAARITGLSVRPMQVAQYVISGIVAFAAGIITATAVESMNTRIVNGTLIYDVILVVVLGGVGLSGGKGGVRNVLVGTLLIGVLLNGMTIMDVQYTVQNVVKSLILLVAIVVDSLVNPRDEQTAQQGDI